MQFRRGVRSFHASLLFFLVFLPVCGAVFINRTIDDTFGDSITGKKPTYLPSSGAWEDQTCSGCDIQPDKKLAFDGTWTAATYNPGMKNMSITLEFAGVAIWVFFILANANQHGPTITSNTQTNFTLDGQHAGDFTHTPDMNTLALQYNATAFNASGLTNTTHQLVISTNDFPVNVFVNFDYAIYTVDMGDAHPTSGNGPVASSTPAPTTSNPASSDHVSSPSSPPNIGIIVGCVLGGFALLLVVVMLFLLLRLRQSKKLGSQKTQAPVLDLDSPNVEAHHDSATSSRTPWQNIMYSDSSERLGRTDSPLGPGMYPIGTVSQARHMPSPDVSPETSNPAQRRRQPFSGHTARSREKLRAMRQTEINERLRSAQQEMNNLASSQSIRTASQGRRATETGQEMASLREQIEELRSQIGDLQGQRQSDWALGLTDEQPPAYAYNV